MSALRLLALLLLAAPAAGEEPCGVWLDRLSAPAARQGDTVELHGSWGESRGSKMPALNRGGPAPMDVVRWSTGVVAAVVPWSIPVGKYKIGVYCDWKDRSRGYTSDWVDFEVLDKDAPRPAPPAPPPAAPKPRAAPEPGPMPNLRVWLWNHPKLYEAISWGKYEYRQWDEAKTAALDRYFQLAWEGKPTGLPDPPADLTRSSDWRSVWSLISEKDALDLYLATVAQSLAVEAGRRVPWSLEDYTPEERAAILSPREMFVDSGNGFRVPQERAGTVLPAPPDIAWNFMRDLVGPDRRSTIVNALQWAADNLIHFEGGMTVANAEAQWQYRGLPPVTRMLAGTPYTGKPERRVRHRTAGCGGTAGFLRAVLRTANIPVLVLERCGHNMPAFPSEKLYLSHGDNPYNTDLDAKHCGAERLLMTEAAFRDWYENPQRTDCTANMRGAAGEALKKPCVPR